MKACIFLVVAFCGMILTTSGQSPTNWQQRNPYPTGEHLSGITYNDGKFVLADQAGGTLTSPDGTIWTRFAGPDSPREIIFAEGRYVAVSGQFGEDGRIYSSTDGSSWPLEATTVLGDLASVAYGNGVFIAAGQTGVLVSDDGDTWTLTSSSANQYFRDVTFGNGAFIAVGAQNTSGLQPLVARSTDGTNWTYHTPPGEGFLQAVAYGNGIFVANGDGGNFLTSADGITWTMHGGVDEPPFIPVIRFSALAFGNGKFVAGSEHYLYYSTNGVDWTQACLRCEGPSSAPFSNASIPFSIAYGNGRFLAVLTNGTIYTATDPAQWSVLRSAEDLNAVTYGNGRFVAVGAESTTWSSPDGRTWTWGLGGKKDIGNPELFGVTFGNGIFVAVGGAGPYIATSPEGAQWTTQQRSALGVFENLRGVTFGNGLFVAAGERWVGPALVPKITISKDGTNWSYPAFNTTASTLYGAGYGNGVYVVVGNQGTILSSPDGSNWTARASGTTQILRAVAFRGNTFFVGGDVGTILTSPDGISWSPGAPTSFWNRGLATGPGGVIAVGNWQNDGRLHFSPNGFSWPGESEHFNKILNGVAYNNGTWVAVGMRGLIISSDSGAVRIRDPKMVNGQFQFWIDNPSHRNYVVEASDDTVHWLGVTVVNNPSESFLFRDPTVPRPPHRLYRVTVP